MEDFGNALLGQEEVEETETPVETQPVVKEIESTVLPVEPEAPEPAKVETPVETPAPIAPVNPATGRTYTQAEWDGLLTDLRAERQRRQQDEEELASLKAAKVEEDKPVLDDLADDELITVGAARKAIPAMARKAAIAAIQDQQVADSECAAIRDLTPEKCGAGLDFASVVQAGTKNLLPGDREAIRNAGSGAAQLAYQLCIDRTPDLKAKHDETRIAALLASQKPTPQKSVTQPPTKAAPAPKPTAADHRQALSLADSLLGHGEEADE